MTNTLIHITPATKPSRKATHTGTCQVCGRAQKLGGGVLSLHGYTTDHGWFEGTCSGSIRLPFELDKSLIDDAILGAQERGRVLKVERDLREANDPSLETVWARVWDKNLGGYVWAVGGLALREVASTFNGIHSVKQVWVISAHKDYVLEGLYRADQENPRQYLNANRAAALDKTILQIDQYVAWQQQRIQNWKACPEALKPVTPK